MPAPSLVIANLGGGGTVTLTGLTQPQPFPRIKYPYESESDVMRQGADGPGVGTTQLGGASRDNGRLEFFCAYLEPAQVAELETKRFAWPPQKLQVSLDGGATWYAACFAQGEDSLDIRNWLEDAGHQEGNLKLDVRGVIS